MDTNKTVIEINGVKLEVDLRTAKRVDEMRVGTRVKVLRKEYGETFKVAHGVIIGFEPFKQLPTIIVAYMESGYNTAEVKWLYYNAKSEGIELVVANDDDLAALDKNDILRVIDGQINTKQNEIKELEARKAFFLSKFSCYWREVEQAVADATAQ